MANRAAGKGYENEDNYDNIRFKFIGIENIHVMRSSLQKLLEGKYCAFEWPLYCLYLILTNMWYALCVQIGVDLGVVVEVN